MSKGCVITPAVRAWSISMERAAIALRHKLDIVPPEFRNSRNSNNMSEEFEFHIIGIAFLFDMISKRKAVCLLETNVLIQQRVSQCF